ncbi:MAG: hypothetical protein GX096_07775 [Clostridiales bacterium]|nr:hypothetical protein [Clostridiales bacterium]
MIKKLLTTFLCLLLALALPIASLAEANLYTVTITPGKDMASTMEGFEELFDVLAIKVLASEEGDAGALVLSLQGTDVASIALRPDDEGLFVQTDAVSSDVMYFSWLDVIDFLAANTEESDDATAMYAMLREALETGTTGTSPAMFSEFEEQITAAAEAVAEDEELINLIMELMESAKVSEGTFTDVLHDAADQKVELTVTSEFYVKLVQTTTFKTLIKSFLSMDDDNTTEAKLNAEVEEAVEELKEIYASSDVKVDMVILTAGEDLVSMSVPFSMNYTEKDDDDTMKMDMNVIYNRLTSDDGVAYTVDVTADGDDDGEKLSMQMEMDAFVHSDESVTATISMLDEDGTQITFDYKSSAVADVKTQTITMYIREGAVSIIAPAASDSSLMTIQLTSEKADDSMLDAVKNATISSSTQLLKFSDTEMAAFMEAAQTNLTQCMMNVLGNLPANVLQMFMAE